MSIIRTLAVLVLLPLATGCISPAVYPRYDPLDRDDGLVTIESSHSVDETFNRLRTAIENSDALTVIATVDHAANAQNAGMQLPPTRLIIFGNPNLGTPLMQSSRTIGIDLPQKFLVWEDMGGQVFITYNDPAYLSRRHGIGGQDEILEQISTALRNLAEGGQAPDAWPTRSRSPS